jgi:nucleotide-binding universal stress UspA family protein
MNRLQTLLAATDLSAPSRHAVLRAAMLARDAGARLELVHVVDKIALNELELLFGDEAATLQEAIRAQMRDALADLAADICEPLGISAGRQLVEGAVLGGIASLADRLDAGLLVVGARGAGFMRHWLLGATAERLLRKTLRPVLVVKQTPHEAYRRALVPMDFSPWSQGALRLAMAIAPAADLILMHASSVPFEGKMHYAGVAEKVIRHHRETASREALARLKQTAVDTGLATANWHPVVIHGDAASRILEQEEEQGADLIVIGKHGAGIIEELLLGSVTKHVLAQARCDVLVAHR